MRRVTLSVHGDTHGHIQTHSVHPTPAPYTHTQKHTFPVSASPLGTDVPPLSSGGTGCHQDDKITLGREHKVLRLGSVSKWHSVGHA